MSYTMQCIYRHLDNKELTRVESMYVEDCHGKH